MEKYLILLGLLIGLIQSNPEVKDLELMTTYTFITSSNEYYFRVASKSYDKMYIELTAKKTNVHFRNDFGFEICGYEEYPIDPQVIRGHDGCLSPEPPILSYDNTYAFYKYTLSTLNNVKYITFHLTIERDNIPQTIYIYSEKFEKESHSLGIAIILLIIFLPCIILAVVIVLVCRFFCGGCRLRVNKGGEPANVI